ncbi:MAG TPA: AAA family ATPase, partial [Nannocystaceae bacterium]|nr:AAA family ATPase [Nannocystaceae bacterium]
MSALFGRTPQLAAARRALDRTRAGCGGVVVVAGEPGIGKSRLLRAIADEAEAAGLRIGIGRAWEVGSAPALWPWAQALRGVGIELADLVGESSGEMASAQRLVAFERVRRRLAELAQAQAIALFVDDAHAADLASLELALHLARSITDSSVLLVVTTREAELRASPAHGELIAKLAREAVRVRLDRFDIDELGRWLASTGFDGDVAAIHGITEGNPLFVEEALRVGIDRFTQLAEGGVALLLDEHLARVSTAALATLGAAAVLGREAAISDVVAVAQCSGDDVDAHVQEGLRAGVLAPAAPGELAFAHVLLRDASYARLGHDARARLHARTAEVLAARGASSSIVAHHLLEAGSVIAAGVVAAGVIAAAQAAMHRHDADSALASIERARPRLGELDDATRLELELVTADAEMRAGRLAEGRARSSACAERAGARNDASALARAALTYGLELMSGALDPEMVRLLEQARAALPNAASTLRARVLARLGAAKTPPRSPEEAQESVALAREAITMARTLGDETTLLFCLRNGASAFGYMLSPTERGELLEELMAIARRRRDDLVLLQAAGFYCTHLAECGRVADAEREADRFCALIERMPLPAMAWRAPATRASMAALRGDFAEAEAQGVELLARARAHGVDNGLRAWALLQVSMACSRRTALAPEIERDVLAILGSVSQLAPWAACVHALAGRATQARAAAAAALAFPRGLPWLISL